MRLSLFNYCLCWTYFEVGATFRADILVNCIDDAIIFYSIRSTLVYAGPTHDTIIGNLIWGIDFWSPLTNPSLNFEYLFLLRF